MFPKLLYPGKSQKEVDKENKIFDFPVDFSLDSINPISWLNCYLKIKKEQPDRVLFQWWHTFFMPSYFVIAFLVKHFTKAKIGVICQNVLPHEKSFIHKILTKIFFSQADYFITLSSSDKKILLSIKKNAKVNFIIEPTYSEIADLKPLNMMEARKELGLPENGKVLLFFGFVRPYKGLKYLIKALPFVLKKFPEITLLIVGEWWENKKKYLDLIKKLKLDQTIKIIDQYIKNEEIPLYFSASNAIVLPYVSSTESGIIQLAFGLELPIITTAVGGNKDLIVHKKTGLLCKAKNQIDLANKIIEFFNENLEKKIKENMKNELKKFEWNKEKEKKVLFL